MAAVFMDSLLYQLKNLWLVLSEAARAFGRNDDQTSASSLAFYSTLAMIPSALLLTYMIGLAAERSDAVLNITGEVIAGLVPQYSGEILKDLHGLSTQTKAIGFLNVIVLLWSITPLITAMRGAFNDIFKTGTRHMILTQKVIDVLLTAMFVLSFAAIAAAGVMLKSASIGGAPDWLKTAAPFFAAALLLFLIYMVFSPKMKKRHLFYGALAAALLWSLMKPAFNLFLTYNPGYGYAFGSLKSLFVIVMWIYMSQFVFLYGAEVAACLRRKEVILIKKLIDGKKKLPLKKSPDLLLALKKGETVFQDGEEGREMYYVLKGGVGVYKSGELITEIKSGKYFGEMSFLLSDLRTATVAALDDVELIRISNENFRAMTVEFPDVVHDMLKEMALRLKRTTEHTT